MKALFSGQESLLFSIRVRQRRLIGCHPRFDIFKLDRFGGFSCLEIRIRLVRFHSRNVFLHAAVLLFADGGKFNPCAIILLERFQNQSQLKSGFGGVRTQLARLFEVRERLLWPTQFCQHEAQVVAGIVVLGVGLNTAPQIRFRTSSETPTLGATSTTF